MCFSAPASFLAAAVTGAAGIAALIRADKRREILLAATPLLFAAQQAMEGRLWQILPDDPHGLEATALTLAFLLFAKVLWPVFAPLAALGAEPDPIRRRWMLACAATGAAVGLYFLWSLMQHPQSAEIVHGHIGYLGGPDSPLLLGAGYFIATAGASAMSSHAAVRWFATIVIASAITTYFLYWDAFSSVWCYFAAVASALIVLHFERARQGRRAVAAR